MNIKRILSCFMALLLFLTGPAVGVENVFAHGNVIAKDGVLEPEPDTSDIIKLATDRLEEDKQIRVSTRNAKSCWEVIHQKNFLTEDGIKCVCETNISEPIANGFNENGEEIFRRKVEARTDFYFEETGEHLCSLFLAFYFVYDGENAWVEDNNLMREKAHVYNDDWKISANEGIYVAPGQCIVTLFSHINDKRIRARTDEFHADIICLKTGEIVFKNVTKGPKEELDTEGIRFTDLGLRTEQVRHNLIREVQETNIEQIRDLENDATDVYRYIRRYLDIAYKDNDGNVVAYVIMHATFRYNIETHEVKCLSTHNMVQQGKADASSRTGNETRTYGGAYGKINLKYLTSKGREKTFEDKIIVKCDPRGSVISAFEKK